MLKLYCKAAFLGDFFAFFRRLVRSRFWISIAHVQNTRKKY